MELLAAANLLMCLLLAWSGSRRGAIVLTGAGVAIAGILAAIAALFVFAPWGPPHHERFGWGFAVALLGLAGGEWLVAGVVGGCVGAALRAAWTAARRSRAAPASKPGPAPP